MSQSTERMYFSHIAAIEEGKVMIAGHLYSRDEERSTRIVLFDNGTWTPLADIPEIVQAIVPVNEDGGTACYLLLRTGVVHRICGEDYSAHLINSDSPLFFSDMRLIGNSLYACGMHNQVWKRTGSEWNRLPEMAGDEGTICTLQSIDGYSESDLFAVGQGGRIFHFDGHRWSHLASPTNFGLNCVRCFSGQTLIGGYHGLVMRGGTEGWKVIAGEKGLYHIVGIEAYGDGVFIASDFNLQWLNNDSLEFVDTGLPGELGFGSFTRFGDTLWSAGHETVACFDGTSWRGFVYPANEQGKT